MSDIEMLEAEIEELSDENQRLNDKIENLNKKIVMLNERIDDLEHDNRMLVKANNRIKEGSILLSNTAKNYWLTV